MGSRRTSSTSLNIFSSETTGPIKVKFHMELLWGGGTKVCSNGPGHMTEMAPMPIYGKNHKKSSSLEPKGRWPWNLVCIIGCSSTTKFAQMVTLGWPWHFTVRSNLVPYAFVWEKGKTMDFSETCHLWFETSYRWSKWQEVSVDIKTLSLGGCMPPALGLYTCIKSWKKMYKIRLKRHCFETCNKWIKWHFRWHQNFVPGGCLPLPWGIYMY